LYPNSFIFNLDQIISFRRILAHTNRVIHVPVVEVASRTHSEHVSITTVITIRRHTILDIPIKII